MQRKNLVPRGAAIVRFHCITWDYTQTANKAAVPHPTAPLAI